MRMLLALLLVTAFGGADSEMRFRLSGSDWQVVPALEVLLVQVDAAWPAPHAADGTLASVKHREASPTSDHNPDKHGDVRAADIGEVVENDGFTLAEAIRLSKDPRVKYVIHEKRMFSSYAKGTYAPFTWRPYGGDNPHLSHVHISLLKVNQDDTSSWSIGKDSVEGDDDMAALQVEELQEALNLAGLFDEDGNVLEVDGVYGAHTQAAFVQGLRNLEATLDEARVAEIIRQTILVPDVAAQ